MNVGFGGEASRGQTRALPLSRRVALDERLSLSQLSFFPRKMMAPTSERFHDN